MTRSRPGACTGLSADTLSIVNDRSTRRRTIERPDTTQAQAIHGIATVVAIAGVLASDSVGLGDTPLWIRLVVAAAIYIGYQVPHLLADAKIRNGRAEYAAAIENRATAQLHHLIANPEGDDSLVVTPPK